MVKEIRRYKASTIGRIIRQAETQRAGRYFFGVETRLYWRLRSPYQVVILGNGKRVFVNLHNGKVFEN